jgi:hypothetical protein
MARNMSAIAAAAQQLAGQITRGEAALRAQVGRLGGVRRVDGRLFGTRAPPDLPRPMGGQMASWQYTFEAFQMAIISVARFASFDCVPTHVDASSRMDLVVLLAPKARLPCDAP